MELIDAARLGERLSMGAAIDALEAAFRVEDPSIGPMRSSMDTHSGSLLVMPATGATGTGVKLVTLTPGNPRVGLPFVNAAYVLFDADTQVPRAVIDGAALTSLRTAAVSGLATRHLANPEAHRLVIFGAGVQARSHVEAMLAVRPVDVVTIVSRTRGPDQALAAETQARGIRSGVGTSEAIAEADLICTCTTSDQPLFEGVDLAPGVHVNAIGSYQRHTRELDSDTIRRAMVVVETREAAMAEVGELVMPIEEGLIDASHVAADLAELVRGANVRTGPNDITVFKSVGIAFEDLVVASAALADG